MFIYRQNFIGVLLPSLACFGRVMLLKQALDVSSQTLYLHETAGRLQATDVRTADGLPVDELEHQAAMAASVDTAQVSVHSDTIQGHKPSNEDRFTMDLTLGGMHSLHSTTNTWIGRVLPDLSQL
jgi:hypothetical protein